MIQVDQDDETARVQGHCLISERIRMKWRRLLMRFFLADAPVIGSPTLAILIPSWS